MVIESSSVVSVLFIEVFNHPYISFFHLLVNGFFVLLLWNKSQGFFRGSQKTDFYNETEVRKVMVDFKFDALYR